MGFIATMSYELHPQTDPDAARLLRAELVGARWQERHEGEKLPGNTLWIDRDVEPRHTTDDVHAACADDLHRAIARVAARGRKIALLRAWIHATGTGTYGLVAPRPVGDSNR